MRELAARQATLMAAPAASPDYEATRQVNLLSRELVTQVAALLNRRGFDPAPFTRVADPVWSKPLRSLAPVQQGWGP